MNTLAKLAGAKVTVDNRTIIQQTLEIPCTDKVMNIKEKESWMTLIITFFSRSKLPNDKKEVRKVECRSTYSSMESGQLYKKGFALLSLQCLNLDKAFLKRDW